MKDTVAASLRTIVSKTNLRFRHKIMLGVGLTLVAGVLTGGVSIYNVREVGKSVSFSVDAASPLLIGVISLSESYQKLQGVFDPVMKDCAGLEGASRFLAVSQESQKRKLSSLKALALKADAMAELDRYEFSGDKIFRTRQALLDVCHANTSLRGDISIADKMVRAAARDIGLSASKSVLDLENRFGSLVKRQPGNVLTEIPVLDEAADNYTRHQAWIRLRDLYRIKIYVSELAMVDSVLADIDRKFDLERKTKTYRARIAALEASIIDLRTHFTEGGRLGDYETLLRLSYQLKRTLYDGPQSLLASRLDLLDREREKQNLLFRLQREQGQYSVALLNIMDVAQRINRNAQQKTEDNAIAASWEIAAGVLLAAILAILIGWYFKTAVTKPLERLTRNISNFGLALRDESRPVDKELLSRGDEIGDLASQFAKTFEDLVQARRQLQEASRAEIAIQRDRLHGAIENMPQGLYMLNGEGRIVVANRQLSAIYNLDEQSKLEGMTVGEFIALCREKGAGVKRVMSDELVAGGSAEGRKTSQRVVQLDDGRYMTMTVMELADGGHVVTHEDITEKKTANDKIAHMALHDGLTGLANRTLFRNHIAWETESARAGHRSALLFLDLDRFKLVNDTLGHPVGDVLLVEVAKRLRDCIDTSCFAARLGGDEFAIFQSSIGRIEDTEALAAAIIRTIAEPFDIEGHQIIIGTSVGIALFPGDAEDADELLKNADLALYCAKQAGRGQFRFFEADMDRRMRDWHEMERDLREAIHARQFELYFQPMVRLKGRGITGFEALIRWHHPTRGFVSPAEFIPVAEEAGLINELGAWILGQACEVAASWPDDVTVAVNISPVQFGSGALPLVVVEALARSGLAPDRLMLEITEGVFLNDNAQTIEILNQLKALGVTFAMDDFGTGYSSLSYICKFQFDKIKIDQSFVAGMASNAESMAIVRAVTNLCRDLGMVTTAEGVETEEQAAILSDLGCVLAQGYYFGRPMPAAGATALVSGQGRLSA